MKMKKTLSLLLAAAMTVSLAACGSTESSAPAGDAAATEDSAASDSTEATDDAAAGTDMSL